jgi:hypothetical protein
MEKWMKPVKTVQWRSDKQRAFQPLLPQRMFSATPFGRASLLSHLSLKLTRPRVNPCRAQQDASASTFCAFLRLFVLWNWEGYIEIIRIPRQLCFWSYSIGQGKLKHNSFSRLMMIYVAYILHPCELHQNAVLWGRASTFFADPCFASLTPFRRNFQVSRPKGASGCDGVSALCCFLARNRAVYAAVW